MSDRGYQSPVHLALPNGWTLSIAQDLSGSGHNVAAFPTDDPVMQRVIDRRWFQFQRGGDSAMRIWGIDELMVAMREVACSSPPAAHRSAA